VKNFLEVDLAVSNPFRTISVGQVLSNLPATNQALPAHFSKALNAAFDHFGSSQG
jgi:hypothetical protein